MHIKISCGVPHCLLLLSADAHDATGINKFNLIASKDVHYFKNIEKIFFFVLQKIKK